MLKLIAVLEQVCTEHRAEHEQEVILHVFYALCFIRKLGQSSSNCLLYVQLYIHFYI